MVGRALDRVFSILWWWRTEEVSETGRIVCFIFGLDWYRASTNTAKLITTIATKRPSPWPLLHAILIHVRFGPIHRGRPAQSRVVKGKRRATSPVCLACGQVQVNVRIYVATSPLVYAHCSKYHLKNHVLYQNNRSSAKKTNLNTGHGEQVGGPSVRAHAEWKAFTRVVSIVKLVSRLVKSKVKTKSFRWRRNRRDTMSGSTPHWHWLLLQLVPCQKRRMGDWSVVELHENMWTGCCQKTSNWMSLGQLIQAVYQLWSIQQTTDNYSVQCALVSGS